MWGAIKNDLFDFVNTIKDDTEKTLNQVLGEEEEEVDSTTVQEKFIADAKRSYETYSKTFGAKHAKDFEKYLKKFNLSSFSTDIAGVLDEEPEVSRFYAELVPLKLTAEEFWARLFFRIQLIRRDGSMLLEDDDDDEEDLTWEEDADGGNAAGADETADDSTTDSGARGGRKQQQVGEGEGEGDGEYSSATVYRKRIIKLEDENSLLKKQVKTLIGRISDLEALLAAAQQATQSTTLSTIQQKSALKSNLGTNNDTKANDLIPPQQREQQEQQVLDQQKAMGRSGAYSPPSSDESAVIVSEAEGEGERTDDDSVVLLPSKNYNSKNNNAINSSSRGLGMVSGTALLPPPAVGGVTAPSTSSATLRAPQKTASTATNRVSAGMGSTTSAPAAPTASAPSPAKFLVALDDDEDEDGWN